MNVAFFVYCIRLDIGTFVATYNIEKEERKQEGRLDEIICEFLLYVRLIKDYFP